MPSVRLSSADRVSAILSRQEQRLKWLALLLGVASTVAIVQDLHPWPMIFGLPFCVIWIFYAWLRRERQLLWINMLFTALYLYGLLRWMLLD